MTTDVTNLESMEVLVPATLVAEYHGSSAAESSAISAAVAAALENGPDVPDREPDSCRRSTTGRLQGMEPSRRVKDGYLQIDDSPIEVKALMVVARAAAVAGVERLVGGAGLREQGTR